MIKTSLCYAFMGFSILGHVSVAVATDTDSEFDANSTESPPSDVVEAIFQEELKNNLAIYGEENGSALAMLLAAKIADELQGGHANSSGDQSKSFKTEFPRSSQVLMKKARKLAGSDELLNALADEVENASSKSPAATCYSENNLGDLFYWVDADQALARANVMALCKAKTPDERECRFSKCD